MKSLHIQNKINEPELASSVGEFLDSLPAVKRVEAGSGEVKPEIVIIDEHTLNGANFNSLETCKNEFPDSAIFLISDNNTIEHAVKMIKAGASDYFNQPVDFEYLKNSIEKVRTAASLSKVKKNVGSIYGFISSKGGLGATVIAVNTAAVIAGKNKDEVALCDLGESGDSSICLDIVPGTTIADLSRNFHRLDDSFIRNAMISHSSGLNLLAAPGVETEKTGLDGGKIEGIINKLSRLYSQIVVDFPSAMVTETTLGALQGCEKIFIILDLSIPGIRNAAGLFKRFRQSGIGEQQLEFVVNRFTKKSSISIKEADKNLEKPVFWVCPNSYGEVFSSITGGTPLVQSQPKSKFSRNINEFVQKIKNPEARKEYRGINKRLGHLF